MLKKTKHNIYLIIVLNLTPKLEFRPLNGDTDEVIFVTVTNNDPTHQVNVTVTPYEVQCQFYSPEQSGWSSSGVVPTARSNRSHTVCLSSHLTIFGASSLVAPEDIDFSDLTVGGDFRKGLKFTTRDGSMN